MKYNLTNEVGIESAKERFNYLLGLGASIELRKLSGTRSSKQNRALHKFFGIISEQLNEMGLEFTYGGVRGFELSCRYSADIIKNYLWRPIQVALFEIESTKNINTKQINEITDVIAKWFGDKGVVLEFPSIETLERQN